MRMPRPALRAPLFFTLLILLASSAVAGPPSAIHTSYGSFDPLAGPPPDPLQFKAAPGNTIRLLQVTGRLSSDEIEALKTAGVRLLGYVPHNTYVADIPASLAQRISALPTVRWIGELPPGWRIESGLLHQPPEELVVRIDYFPDEDSDRNRQAVRDTVSAWSGGLIEEYLSIPVLRARVPAAALVDLARLPGVRWIEQWHPPQPAMDNGRYQLGARPLHVHQAWDGSGIVGEIRDNGIDLTHPDFGNLIGTHGDIIMDLHGTGTFGIVFADGAAGSYQSLRARGMMTGGSGVFCDWRVGTADSVQEPGRGVGRPVPEQQLCRRRAQRPLHRDVPGKRPGHQRPRHPVALCRGEQRHRTVQDLPACLREKRHRRGGHLPL